MGKIIALPAEISTSVLLMSISMTRSTPMKRLFKETRPTLRAVAEPLTPSRFVVRPQLLKRV
jgi:hypothetical protein